MWEKELERQGVNLSGSRRRETERDKKTGTPGHLRDRDREQAVWRAGRSQQKTRGAGFTRGMKRQHVRESVPRYGQYPKDKERKEGKEKAYFTEHPSKGQV